VVLTDILTEEGEAIAAAIKENGGDSLFITHDVSSEDEWEQILGTATAEFGALHVLVNNAGIGALGDVESETLETWNRLLSVNQTGVWLGMKTAGPYLRETGNGSVVNVSSIYGVTGGNGTAIAYHSSKGAVTLMTKNAAVFYASKGVRVNSVHPGFIATPMISEENIGKEAAKGLDQWIQTRTPMARKGQPEEVAAAIVFLASDDSSYMTGSELYVDGGWTAW
jgi:NAD(P)-dependent dehydrogenase (short-subunit alcohol dehydrogenase family)